MGNMGILSGRILKEDKMEKKKINFKIRLIFILCFTFALSIPNDIAFASTDIASSQLGVGLKKLIEDIGKYLIIIAVPTGTAVSAYFFIRRGMADEMDHKKWSNRIITAVISTIGAVVAGVIISVFGSYFGA